MRRRLVPVLLALSSVSVVTIGCLSPAADAAPAHHPAPGPARKLEMGFFEQWSIYGRGFSLAQADREGEIADLTDIDYAFGGALPAQGAATDPSASNPVSCQSVDSWADWATPYLPDVNGGNPVAANGLAGNFQQLVELKAKHPGLRAIMSLGGYSGSKFFSDAAATPASRQAFVSSCIDLFIKGNLPGLTPGAGSGVFDGFDLDWEYPGNNNGSVGNHYSAADVHNFPLLAAEFRHQLDALKHGHYRLTAEMGVGLQNAVDLDIPALARNLDDLVLMDYDFQGPWNAQGPTNFESNLFTSPFAPDTTAEPRISVESSVRYFQKHGAPASKLVVGIPYYGHGWTGVEPGRNNGLYQPATGPAASPDLTAAGTVLAGLDGADPSGTTSYYEVANQPGYRWHTDPVTGATWLYNPTTKTFWSMQNPRQTFAKGIYITLCGLAGASVWDLGGDADNALTSALTRGLHPFDR